MGASERIDQISTDDWCIFAKATGYAPGFVLKRVAAIAEAVVTHADEVAKALVEQGADRARIERAVAVVQTSAQRMRQVA